MTTEEDKRNYLKQVQYASDYELTIELAAIMRAQGSVAISHESVEVKHEHMDELRERWEIVITEMMERGKKRQQNTGRDE